nr:helix-turn-helix transcriptional regulator [Paenibacillus turpanensis]
MTERQLNIIELVRSHAPITAEQIAEQLGLSRPTIRSDLALLVMLGYLDAKPKVGYFIGEPVRQDDSAAKLEKLLVKDVLSLPVVVRTSSSVQDAVIALFTENVGSLFVCDEQGQLAGVISRKDLLKVTLGNAAAALMPVSLVMTRHLHIVSTSPDESVLEAARKMIRYQVDSLPVLQPNESGEGELVGRISKTTMTNVLLELGGKGRVSP